MSPFCLLLSAIVRGSEGEQEGGEKEVLGALRVALCVAPAWFFCNVRACAYRSAVMVDEATKKTLASIPLLRTHAGPRDGDQWAARLKEEYISLIKVTPEVYG